MEERRRRTEEERNSKNLELLEATRREGTGKELKDWNESGRHIECIKPLKARITRLMR